MLVYNRFLLQLVVTPERKRVVPIRMMITESMSVWNVRTTIAMDNLSLQCYHFVFDVAKHIFSNHCLQLIEIDHRLPTQITHVVINGRIHETVIQSIMR